MAKAAASAETHYTSAYIEDGWYIWKIDVLYNNSNLQKHYVNVFWHL